MVGYAPHIYTLAFTGTEAQYQSMNKEQLRRSHENARTEADAWKAPLVVTEWGFDPGATKANEYLTWQSELFEEYRASSFFWLWKEQSQGAWGCFSFDSVSSWSERLATTKSLARVRAARIAGWPSATSYDRTTGTFELKFNANPSISAPHVVAVAPSLGTPLSAECDGEPTSFVEQELGMFEISCAPKKTGEHTLRVAVAPSP
jgi:hypothetical protein